MKKSIGLEVKPPQGTCSDQKCPWHGTLPVRGKSFQGSVKSVKSAGTAVIQWQYPKFVPKFERYERRKSRLTAHNPSCIKAKEGDEVVVVECRPLSKTKSFVVVGLQHDPETPPKKASEKQTPISTEKAAKKPNASTKQIPSVSSAKASKKPVAPVSVEKEGEAS